MLLDGAAMNVLRKINAAVQDKSLLLLALNRLAAPSVLIRRLFGTEDVCFFVNSLE
jgi:hypothetical protein